MEKIGALTRRVILEEAQDKIKKSGSCFFVGFSKLPAFPLNLLRNNIRRAGGQMFLVKNALLKKAFDTTGWQANPSFFEKETAVVFCYDKDMVGLCKVLVDFTKDNESFFLKGGFLADKKIEAQDISSLAKLPPKEVLIAQVVSGFASPLTGFVCTLNQIIVKFVLVLEEVKKKKK